MPGVDKLITNRHLINRVVGWLGKGNGCTLVESRLITAAQGAAEIVRCLVGKIVAE